VFLFSCESGVSVAVKHRWLALVPTIRKKQKKGFLFCGSASRPAFFLRRGSKVVLLGRPSRCVGYDLIWAICRLCQPAISTGSFARVAQPPCFNRLAERTVYRITSEKHLARVFLFCVKWPSLKFALFSGSIHHMAACLNASAHRLQHSCFLTSMLASVKLF
jgi:hypothetical protein